jgi:hypothetical protein
MKSLHGFPLKATRKRGAAMLDCKTRPPIYSSTSASWLNLVERWFGEITRKRIRRDVFTSVPELLAAIDEFIRLTNKNPTPFV